MVIYNPHVVSIADTKECQADSVDFPGTKPSWFGLSHRPRRAKQQSRFRIIFSRIFAEPLTRLIGRKLDRLSYVSLLGLPMMTTLAVF